MSDPIRMIETEDGLGSALLASADQDRPSSGSKSRAAKALGIGVVASAGAVVGSGVAEGVSKGAGATAATGAAKGPFFAGLSVSKLLIVAALGGGTTLALSYGVKAGKDRIQKVSQTELASPRAVADSVAPQVQAGDRIPGAELAAASPEAAPTAADALGTEMDVPEEEPIKVKPPIKQETASLPATASEARAGIARELALINQARSESGETSLRTLAAYRSQFPGGALRQEALALEIEALRSLGQGEKATQLVKKFQTKYPRSPLLRGLLLPPEAP